MALTFFNENIALSDDSEFTSLVDGDTTVEIIGTVDFVISPVVITVDQFKIFKFCLTNGSKKLNCLIWGDSLIKKYQANISTARIVHIDGGTVREVDLMAALNKNVVPFELTIMNNTRVFCYGLAAPQVFRKIQFTDLNAFTGLIILKAWIKRPFQTAITSYGNAAVSGIGSITDGTYKVEVKIINYEQMMTFEKGAAIIIEGVIEFNGEVVEIIAMDSSKIIRNFHEKPLPIWKIVEANKKLLRR